MSQGPVSIDGRHLVCALGALYLLVAIVTAVVPTSHDESVGSVLVTFAFIGGSGLVLVGGGYRLSRTDIAPQFYRDVFGRTLAGIGVMLAILTLYHVQPDIGLSEPQRSLPILTGFAGVAGFAVGIFDARAKTRELELERRKRQLERTQVRLAESNERLEQFAYAASHDLQEPLRMVSSYLQLIDDRHGEELDEEAIEFLEYALDGSERMTEMIDGLLQYSRVDTQGDPFEPVSLEAVLDDVRRNLELRIEESNAEIECAELPRVEGDASQLRQLFQNVLANAIQYSDTEGGPPRIEIDAERGETPRPSERRDATVEIDADDWVIAVTDDGIGIDPADQERIFEVFQRLHTQEERAGTGIGLALCKRIIERHGGDIWIDSEPGAGTTISMTLPAVSTHDADRPLQRNDQ
ncbi:sensor histidine kinase [Natrarchaeobius chitinivorans]|uniref:histidine kinase n=1 Tax=Natrarchaeobius chitinivorans TaxID=1679083 RepID=A0A3N6NAA3_NATCH|nr:ATP-binding protein [Natrarchaeobius chitinivorans]RQG95532.1 histidine kinase [Natrarchaeobius chitinivorans]